MDVVNEGDVVGRVPVQAVPELSVHVCIFCMFCIFANFTSFAYFSSFAYFVYLHILHIMRCGRWGASTDCTLAQVSNSIK